jgi:hypothetical protein
MKAIIVLLLVLVPFFALAQESKDLKSFANMEISVKAPMNAKILVDNQSVFAKNLTLSPDPTYKKMDLAANWGTVAQKTEFLPESNQAVTDFFFSFRKVDLEQLLAFKTAMDESEDGNMVEAGLYDLIIKTSRSKYVTGTVEFTLNGKTIKRNVNFLLEPIIEKDKEYEAFVGELPIFKAVITDELLGIPVLTLSADSKIPFDCLIKNDDLGINFVVDASKKDETSFLASKMPKDGVYDFDCYFEVGANFVPNIKLRFLINDGKISLHYNPFLPADIATKPKDKYSMVTLTNNRNEGVTLIVPKEYVGKNSGFGKTKNTAEVISGSGKVQWEIINIAPHSKTKVWLKKTFFRSMIYCEATTEVLDVRVQDKPSQEIAINW